MTSEAGRRAGSGVTIWLALLALAACGDAGGPAGHGGDGAGGVAATSGEGGPAETAGGPGAAVEVEATGRGSVSSAAARAGEAPDGRLPGNARPLRVALDLTVDPREDTFRGLATLDVVLSEPLPGLWLHGNRLDVERVTAITPVTARAFSGSWEQVLDSGVAWLDFGGVLLGPGEIRLEIEYEAAFDRNLAGLFAVQEQGGHYALAKSESIQARKFMPAFDEPAYKAPYDISLTVPAGYEAVSNGPEIGREPAGPGMERVSFATTRPLPSYLLSLAVGPFDVVQAPPLPPNEVRDRPIPLRGIARSGRARELAYILRITPEFVRILEESLGVPYPYAKLDIVAAPQWPSGATELAAAITYREQRILSEGEPPPALRRALIGVHAHELAHTWFGNLVTPPWWDDLWLKEGFATWATPFVLSQWEPAAGHGITAQARVIDAMRTDSLKSARSVRDEILGNDDIRNAYTSITYSKGMGVIAMVDAWFGPERFRPALGRYVAAWADGVASSDDFFATIGRAAEALALTEAFRSFVERPGVPLVAARLQCDAAGGGPRVTLSQQRYAPLGSAIDTRQRWVIPLCVSWSADTTAGAAADTAADPAEGRVCTLMREETEVLALGTTSCPARIHPNAGGSGYYRWSLAPAAFEALLEAFEALAPGEALSAVDSIIAAFEAGQADAATLLQAIREASAHDERLVVTAPAAAISRYVDGPFAGPVGERLAALAGSLYAPRLAALSSPADEDERLLAQTLTDFLALTVEDPAVRGPLAAAAAAFVGLDTAPQRGALDSDQYETAFTVAVQDLGAPFFERLLQARGEIDDPRFDAASATALGRVRDGELLARAQNLALSGDLGTRETWALVSALFEDPAHRDAIWDWYRQHFAALLERIPEQWRRRTPSVGRHFCDAEAAASLERFFAQAGAQAPGHERALAQAVERIGLCAALRDARRGDLADALGAPAELPTG